TDEDVAKWEIRLRSDAPISCFPREYACVQVTATFGWPSLPGAAEESILRLASNIFIQDQQNRRGRLVAAGDFDVEVRGSAVFTSDIKRDLGLYRFAPVG